MLRSSPRAGSLEGKASIGAAAGKRALRRAEVCRGTRLAPLMHAGGQ
jgi:hypothetical protein